MKENHNSRVAFFSAQLYPCGVGVESKFSTSTGHSETYVAIRLGQHLNSAGTATVTTAQRLCSASYANRLYGREESVSGRYRRPLGFSCAAISARRAISMMS